MSYALPAGCKDARDLLIKAKTDNTMMIREFKDVPCIAVFHVDTAFRCKLDRNPAVSIPYLRMFGHVVGYKMDEDINTDAVFPNGDAEISVVGEDEMEQESEMLDEDDLYHLSSDIGSPSKSVYQSYTFSKSDREQARMFVVDYQFDAHVEFDNPETGTKQHINEFGVIFAKGWQDDNYQVTNLDKTELEIPVTVDYTQCIDMTTGDSVAVVKSRNYAEMTAMTSGYFNFTDMLDDIKDLEHEDVDDFSIDYADEDDMNYEIHEEAEPEAEPEAEEDYRTEEEIAEDNLVEDMGKRVESDYEQRVAENEELKAAMAEQKSKTMNIHAADTDLDSDSDKKDSDKNDADKNKSAENKTVPASTYEPKPVPFDRDKAVAHMSDVAGMNQSHSGDSDEYGDLFSND